MADKKISELDLVTEVPAGSYFTFVDPNEAEAENRNKRIILADSVDIQVFDTAGSHTWTKPANAQVVATIVVGAGGGGGSGQKAASNANRRGGGGGGGGAARLGYFTAANLSATESITVGAGGSGGAAETSNSSTGASGSNGGHSSFGTLLKAGGGGGGSGGNVSTGIGGGGGGADSASGSAAGAPASAADGLSMQGVPGRSGGSAAYNAEYGGGGGSGGAQGAGAKAGGSSLYGGGAGGGGAGASSSAVPGTGGVGGQSGSYVGGGGATEGQDGADNSTAKRGYGGGGGGGGVVNLSGNSGKGGDGGSPGGGGGGGAAGTNDVGDSGAGGDGGDGYVIVITWCQTPTGAGAGGGGGEPGIGGTKTLFSHSSWVENMPPSGDFATLGVHEFLSGLYQGVMEFSASTEQTAYALVDIPQGANLSEGLSLSLLWGCNATSGTVGWKVAFAIYSPDGAPSSWGTEKTITAASVPADATHTKMTSVTFAAEDLPAGMSAESWVLLRIKRDVATDTAADIARLIGPRGKAVA